MRFVRCITCKCLPIPYRKLIERICFKHGGDDFDRCYPDGIPTQVEVDMITSTGEMQHFDSGMILYPLGHCRNNSSYIKELLMQKFIKMGMLGLDSSVNTFIEKLQGIGTATSDELLTIYEIELSKQPHIDSTNCIEL